MTLLNHIRQTILLAKGKKFTVEHLAAGYDKISTNYNHYFNQPLESCYDHLLDLSGDISDKSILDLGCGTCWLGKKLVLNFPVKLYHGIDISTGMIYQARNSLCDFSNTKLEHGNFVQILDQISPNSYDFVFLTWSLKFNNPKLLFAKILKVLKPGGKLAILTETSDSTIEITNALETVLKNNSDQVDLVLPKSYLPENAYNLTESLNQAGFAQTVVWNKTIEDSFSNPDEILKWAHSLGLFCGWDQILDFSQPKLVDELKSAIEPMIPGKWLLNRKILGALARKEI